MSAPTRTPPAARQESPVPRIALGFAVAVLGAASLWVPNATMGQLAIGFGAVSVGLLVAAWTPQRGSVNAVSVYLIVFSLFHGGLIFATALIGAEAYDGVYERGWITAETLQPAAAVVAVGMLAFAVGAALAPRLRLMPRGAPDDADELIGHRVALAGRVMLVFGALVLIPRLANAGDFLSLGYGEVFALGEGRFASFAFSFVTTGSALMIAAGGRYRKQGWILFAVTTVVLLPLGLRGPILFTLVGLAVIEGRRRRYSWALLAPAAVALLTVTSIIRQTRNGGFRALLDPTGVAAEPLHGLAELGFSIRPVVEVQQWMAGGLEPWHGQTLVAPFIRALERVAGIAPAGGVDLRIFSVEIQTRVGAIGGSPVAEGLRNGGLLFAVGLMLVIGIVVGAVDRLPSTPLTSAIVVLFLVPLLIDIRNDFAAVAGRWVIGVIVVAIVVNWPPPQQRQQRRDRRRELRRSGRAGR